MVSDFGPARLLRFRPPFDETRRLIARPWYERMRRCGDDVRELVHDGHPTACAGDAAFGHVNAFTAHAALIQAAYHWVKSA